MRKEFPHFPIPDEVLAHRADIRWLEEHGQAALAEFIKTYTVGDEIEATDKFARRMFQDPETGMLMAWVPNWYRKWRDEQFEKFRRAATEEVSLKVAEGTDRMVEATVVETRGRIR
jgi:hypothetical protein